MKFIRFHFFLLLVLLVGCAPPRTSGAVSIDLSELQPLPLPKDGDIQPLRVAISAVISPKGSADSYAPLLAYIERALGRPVEAIQRRTYAEVNDLIENGEVDLAFVCTSQYLVGSREFGMRLLAAPQVNGETTYHAQIIVPYSSSARSMADLRGKIFAFTDPLSLTGQKYPTYILHEMGETPGAFFSRTIFTYSHDDAIYAVAHGVADGASVDSLVLDFALKRDPGLGDRIRIIHTSEPFGIPPVVVGAHIRPQVLAELQEILLDLHTTSEGQVVLAALDYDRFVLISHEAYQSAELIQSTVGNTH